MKQMQLKKLIHPLRMRIIQALLIDEKMTVQEILGYLEDVPQATLYRHLKILQEVEMIEVVQENKIRGTIEKVYSLKKSSEADQMKDIKEISPEEHGQLFFSYLSSILNDFETYFKQPDYDIVKDLLSYTQARFYMSDEELKELFEKIGELFMKYVANKPSEERVLRIISTIVIPDKKKK